MPLYIFDVFQQDPNTAIMTRQGVVVVANGKNIAQQLIYDAMGKMVRVEFKRTEPNHTNQVILVGTSDIVSGH